MLADRIKILHSQAIASGEHLVDNYFVMAVSQSQELGTLSGLSALPNAFGVGPAPRLNIAECSLAVVDRLVSEEVPSGRRSFRGRIVMPGINCFFPEQSFIETRTDDEIVLTNEPEGKWPTFFVELRRERLGAPFRCTAMRAFRADDSAEAWLLLTRFMFSATLCEKCSIVDDQGTVLELVPSIDSALTVQLRHLSSVVRKLSYIAAIFNVDFRIPELFTHDDLRTIELVFRAITEGEFRIRMDEVTFRQLNLAMLDIGKPPFTAPGPFSVRRETSAQTRFSMLGHDLELGPYTISAGEAEIANHSTLIDLEGDSKRIRDIKFFVYDHQVKYSFDYYAGKKDRKISSAKLSTFKKELLKEEPEQMVDLIDESLQSEVSSFEASQIAMGWLQYNNFPDRYCPQNPILDDSAGKWRVPIHLAYPSGKGGPVGEVTVDLKTGVLDSTTSIEAVRAEGAALAARLFDAR